MARISLPTLPTAGLSLPHWRTLAQLCVGLHRQRVQLVVLVAGQLHLHPRLLLDQHLALGTRKEDSSTNTDSQLSILPSIVPLGWRFLMPAVDVCQSFLALC